jgi:hypothetical protein
MQKGNYDYNKKIVVQSMVMAFDPTHPPGFERYIDM